MKIRQLFEFEDESFEDWYSPEMVSIVKKNCSQFINEFLKNNIKIYRGLNDIGYDFIHLVPTEAHREVHGVAFSYNNIRESFENFLGRNGVSRYSKSVSTISFEPEDFDGIHVDSWFFFIPLNRYTYHYYDIYMESGDINVDVPEFDDLTVLAQEFYVLEDSIEFILENNISDETRESILTVHDEQTLRHIIDSVNSLSDIIDDVFNIDETVPEKIRKMARKFDVFLRHIDAEDDDFVDSLYDVGTSLQRISSKKLLDSVLKLRNSLVVGELPREGSEIVFTCERYYVVPYSKDGLKFINELVSDT